MKKFSSDHFDLYVQWDVCLNRTFLTHQSIRFSHDNSTARYMWTCLFSRTTLADARTCMCKFRKCSFCLVATQPSLALPVHLRCSPRRDNGAPVFDTQMSNQRPCAAMTQGPASVLFGYLNFNHNWGSLNRKSRTLGIMCAMVAPSWYSDHIADHHWKMRWGSWNKAFLLRLHACEKCNSLYRLWEAPLEKLTA